MTGACVCVDCAVRRTLARYHMAGDRGRLDDLAATFTADGILDTAAWRAKGRAEIVTRLQSLIGKSNPALTTVRHSLTTSLIEPAGDGTMTARSYFLVTTDIGLDHSGSYLDRLVPVGQEWLLAERKARLNWVSHDTLFDLEPLPKDRS